MAKQSDRFFISLIDEATLGTLQGQGGKHSMLEMFLKNSVNISHLSLNENVVTRSIRVICVPHYH